MVDIHDQSLQATKWNLPLFVFFKDARFVFKLDELGLEILRIALPAALALAADPIASLIDTAFIGHLGSVELAAVGVAIAVFNQASKVAIFPLVSITTSFVAEENTVRKLRDEALKGSYLAKISVDDDIKGRMPEDVVRETLKKVYKRLGETNNLMPGEEEGTYRRLSAEAPKEETSKKNLAIPEHVVLDNLKKCSLSMRETEELIAGKDMKPITCHA